MESSNSVSTKYMVPESVDGILRKGCYDCHSNQTVYPWYSQVQPFGWWLNHHIGEGRRELNFSNFTGRPIAVQNHKFEEVIETVREGEMPLPSYTWLGMHPEAKLSEGEKNVIVDWAKAQMALLKQQYPADSLKMKKRPPVQQLK